MQASDSDMLLAALLTCRSIWGSTFLELHKFGCSISVVSVFKLSVLNYLALSACVLCKVC